MSEFEFKLANFPQIEPDVYDVFAPWRELGGKVLSIGFYLPPPVGGLYEELFGGHDPTLTFDMWMEFDDPKNPKRYGHGLSLSELISPRVLLFKLGDMDFRLECKGKETNFGDLATHNPHNVRR